MLLLAFRDMTDPWELNAQLERRIAEGTAELEQASDELERRRSYLETIVEHIPAGLVIADAETGDITLANERSLRDRRPGERAADAGGLGQRARHACRRNAVRPRRLAARARARR